MIPPTELENVTATMCARIDELSTNLVLHGCAGVRVEDLDAVAVDAEQSGCPEAARVATSLAAHMRVKLLNEGELQPALCAGLTEMKRLLEQHHEAGERPADVVAFSTTKATAATSFSEDAELISDFLVEAREHLALIESQMLELEKDPHAMEVLHSVFRTFHTIKGLAGFLDFGMIQGAAHEVETLLDLARNEKLLVDSSVVDVVLEGADYLKQELNRIESNLAGGAPETPADNRALIQKIERLTTGDRRPEATTSGNSPRATPSAVSDPSAMSDADPHPPGASSMARVAKVPTPSPESAKSSDAFSVRVETAKLDHLLDMVGEMVIAQSLIRHNPVLTSTVDARLLADITQLSRNTAEVQRTTMSMRMIPVGQLFQRTARLVRDLSRKAGKQIVLETAGEDTEVDKTIAEELADPLLHMVRNSVDHGIELPQERIAAGKDPEARIRLKAYHQAGQIVIEISDDGRGLPRGKILAKALQNGVIAAGDQLSEAEIYQLIFEPGFSTAEKVTDVSGRGVGMDVVRRNVQKLRGRIDTQSTAGQGTTFLLKLPLTLAIIEGLVVLVGSSRYIVPIFAVREMFRPSPKVLSTVQGRHEMAMVRGNLLPIVRLNRRFGIPSNAVDPCSGLLVVVECDNKQFCLLVDDLVGKQEVVIKSLGETFKDVSGLAGCAILGDGRVGLILDVEGIHRGSVR
jgi:two-component system, chemotaxis family, sensor kinase CheA